LELPYRANLLCSGELSFAADKSYSLEVLSAGTGKWLEVSTVSHFGDFQARRANIRFRDGLGSGSSYLHTMSGSGLAIPRLFIALLEDYQLPGGGVMVPPVLRPYMGGMEEIVRR
jgi:seryl-tRNA synthetase